jgi:hypothetical protein
MGEGECVLPGGPGGARGRCLDLKKRRERCWGKVGGAVVSLVGEGLVLAVSEPHLRSVRSHCGNIGVLEYIAWL